MSNFKCESKINIKPFSINKARQGKQYKTEKCAQFMENLSILLLANTPKVEIPEGDLEIHFIFGLFYYTVTDADNCVKVTQDVICSHYGIDDKRFIGGSQRKIKVPKGQEFIQYIIREYNPKRWFQFTELNPNFMEE